MTNERPHLDTRTERDREALTGPPRWVKVSALIAGILILVVVAVMLLTGGEHGPARHGLGAGADVSVSAVLGHAETLRSGRGTGQG